MRNRMRFTACMLLLSALPVHAEVTDFETAEALYQQQDEMSPVFQVDDGDGNTVNMIGWEDTLYILQKEIVVRSCPGSNGSEVGTAEMGMQVQRTAVCDNGWSKISYRAGEDEVSGYVPNDVMDDTYIETEATDTDVVMQDSEVLDYPGKKDGIVCGQVTAMQEVQRASEEGGWSCITYTDASGTEITGYVPSVVFEEAQAEETVPEPQEDQPTEDTSVPESQEDQPAEEATVTESSEMTGTIHKSSGTGVFAKAVTEVPSVKEDENGVQIGAPVAASSDSSLVSLGVFRITHYCPCSICCGPWANGITSTGVTAVTNHTIAVNPSQIPYGSKVVINGQVYVAEDCGGAIKDNCIDIYVATHEEGESKGVYYTEVYLIQ